MSGPTKNQKNRGGTKGAEAKQSGSGSKVAKVKRAATSGKSVAPASGGVLRSASTGRTVTKTRRTVTLDIDVVNELESRGGSVSAHLNEFAIRCLEWDRRQAQIEAMVAEYEAEFGEIDEADVKRWEDILS